jgi:hypothetical protein
LKLAQLGDIFIGFLRRHLHRVTSGEKALVDGEATTRYILKVLSQIEKYLFQARPLLLIGVASLATSWPQALRADPIPLIANETGVLKYPSSSPDAVGNESQATPTDNHTATDVTLNAHLNETREGTDSSSGTPGVGTYGKTSILGSTTAQAGHLVSSSSATVLSIPATGSHGLFPHGQAGVEGFAKFSDQIKIYNPGYGAFVPVTIHASLDWKHALDLGLGGSNFVEDRANVQMGLDWLGSVNLSNDARSDVPVAPAQLQGTFSGGAYNNQTLGFWGTLDVYAFAAVNVQGTVPSLLSSSSADSMGDALFTIEAPEGTIITSASGHDYLYHASQSVPEPASTTCLIGLSLLSLAGLRRTFARI